ncbi:MAG: bifunctional adenosylcobinamide kinase/adenosylcobinamide-phosphate guanylyltransferase [Chloroflexi bacterium]|nr:bifunctional adenosylcobinamide kinase/adenosylcobinamide-phosphate guanylyltransferase [Chloroflexota bacterium]
MGKITLLLGGARSGKSSYAQRLAEESGKTVTYLATAQALDDEMSLRIQKHQSERPAHWQTLEIPLDVAAHVGKIQSELVILDCMTLLVTNLMMQFVSDDLVDEAPFAEAVYKGTADLLAAIRAGRPDWLIISNEIGLGLVPPYQMGRVYRDLLGWANQRLAREADKVVFLAAGIPITIKQPSA